MSAASILLAEQINSSPATKTANPVGIVDTKPSDGIFVAVDDKFMVPYTAALPGSDIIFTMVPIPGGTFIMGSAENSVNHRDDEGPQRTIEVPPFWMQKTEVTWAEYKTFMSLYPLFKKLVGQGVRPITKENLVDAITVPTPLYEPSHTYEYGSDPQQPAVTMTQYAAKQYTKWMSGMTGLQYRLPSEAEWEYAARAGSTTAYSFGDDPAMLDQYASFADNSEQGPAKVASFKPNAFGLYDMHGSAWEWVIDGFDLRGYTATDKNPLTMTEAISWPTSAESRVVRGGGFQDGADHLRSATRMPSADEDWKDSDPNIPLSPWWYTSDPARSVGMRLVRSYQPLEASLIKKFYDIDHEYIELDVDIRLEEGRGVLGLPVPELADDMRADR